jgi:hypothetical protein
LGLSGPPLGRLPEYMVCDLSGRMCATPPRQSDAKRSPCGCSQDTFRPHQPFPLPFQSLGGNRKRLAFDASKTFRTVGAHARCTPWLSCLIVSPSGQIHINVDFFLKRVLFSFLSSSYIHRENGDAVSFLKDFIVKFINSYHAVI